MSIVFSNAPTSLPRASRRRALRRVAAAGLALALVASACGDDDTSATSTDAAASATGITTVSADAAAVIHETRDEQLTVLDVRTPEEFTEGHLEDAAMIDFYEPDFADQIAQLDPDAEYLVYCRSGSRSGQTVELMAELGFTNVTEVAGGIQAWTEAGHPVVR